jgi:hypothetical protein
MDRRKVLFGGVDWIPMALNRDQWWALVIMNFRDP